MSLTLPDLQTIRDTLTYASMWDPVMVNDALEIVRREIDQMTQDQLLSESKANPT